MDEDAKPTPPTDEWIAGYRKALEREKLYDRLGIDASSFAALRFQRQFGNDPRDPTPEGY